MAFQLLATRLMPRRMPRAKLLKVMDMNDGTIAENAAEVAAKNAAVAS